MDFIAQYKAARRVSTPLVCVRTFDAKATRDHIREALGDKFKESAMLLWDTNHGLRALNQKGTDELGHILNGSQPDMTIDFPSCLTMLEGATQRVTVYVANAHLQWANREANVIQGIWNLRDTFKANANMLVLLVAPGATLPAELANDVMMLDEPLPSEDEIRQRVAETYSFAKLDVPDEATMQSAVDALVGVPAFAAEQSTAMCLNIIKSNSGERTGKLDLDELWEHKRQTIAQTPGLTVYRGKETLADVGGLAQVKRFFQRVMEGNDAPKAVIYIDEIEKAVAGAGTDMSGVKGEMHGTMLSWMQDSDIQGLLFIGLPGTSKSYLTKCGGNTYQRPTINFDLAGMQGGIIGQSGANLRQAQKVVDAISGSRTLCIATCNSIEALSPELRARFTLGTFFFDAPDAEEKKGIWAIHRAKWNIPANEPNPNDAGWVGREIAECCKKAYRLRTTLAEAATYVVPVTKSSADLVHNLRVRSSNKYLHASKPGLFTYAGAETAAHAAPVHAMADNGARGRVLRMDED